MLWWFPEDFQASQVCSLCSCAIFAIFFFIRLHCFLSFRDRNLRVELIDRKVKAVTWGSWGPGGGVILALAIKKLKPHEF